MFVNKCIYICIFQQIKLHKVFRPSTENENYFITLIINKSLIHTNIKDGEINLKKK